MGVKCKNLIIIVYKKGVDLMTIKSGIMGIKTLKKKNSDLNSSLQKKRINCKEDIENKRIS